MMVWYIIDEATKRRLKVFQRRYYGQEVAEPNRDLPELETLSEIDKIMREPPHYDRIKI